MWRNFIVQAIYQVAVLVLNFDAAGFESRLLREISASIVLLLFPGISSIHESNLANIFEHILGLIYEALNKLAKGRINIAEYMHSQ
ncbi:hypothetical protein OROMI_014342 [Orobanche minor]